MIVLSPNLNILTDPVFPVLTRSGVRRWADIRGLLDQSGDFPVSFDWPRADLNIASAELAIGLLGLIYQPGSSKDWLAIWCGNSKVDVDARIASLAPHFALFGDAHGIGPRFCQDFEPLSGEANAVEALFIDTPGVNGHKKNSDLLTHRGRFGALGLKAAAMALYALQQFAPSGGLGNRTSMRGGGPMTVLVMPIAVKGEVPLFCTLALNLPIQFGGDNAIEEDEIARVLPWLKPTITSDSKPPREIASADPAAHPAQAFFGMPRRIRLVADGEGICPLTRDVGALVTGFVQKPWGVSYSVWNHPLTPYRQIKEEPRYSVKPKSSRLSYRDWVGVAIGWEARADKAFPPENIAALVERQSAFAAGGITQVRLIAAGWAMSSMEAETYLHSVQPLHLSTKGGEGVAQALQAAAKNYLDATEGALRALKSALNTALFDGQAKATDVGAFGEATDTFYSRTEQAFHYGFGRVVDAGVFTADDASAWLGVIRGAALAIFDRHATDLLGISCDAKLAQRVTSARTSLLGSLSAASKLAQALGVAQKPATAAGSKSRKAP